MVFCLVGEFWAGDGGNGVWGPVSGGVFMPLGTEGGVWVSFWRRFTARLRIAVAGVLVGSRYPKVHSMKSRGQVNWLEE